MKLVFLHGKPATGKLTVARKLVTLTNYRLYHNHIAVDQALQLHAFGTPEFVGLRDRLWRDFFVRISRENPSGVIFTFNPENSVPQAFIDWIFTGLLESGIALCSVELTASESVIEDRMTASSRHHFNKLTDLGLYRQLRAAGTFLSPVIPRTDQRIDTGKVSPTEAARQIAAHFGLNPPPPPE